MLSAAIVTVMAAGSGSLSPACTMLLNSPPVLSARKDRRPNEVRQSFREALLHSATHHNPDALQVTPELLLLYWELSHPKSMPSFERRKMLRSLKVRLEFQWKRLERIQRRERRTARRSPRSRLTRGEVASAAGPDAVQAARLIDLIRNTIEPDSWDVNGGLGRIAYYGDPLFVLVIRNTADVHHQLGGNP